MPLAWHATVLPLAALIAPEHFQPVPRLSTDAVVGA